MFQNFVDDHIGRPEAISSAVITDISTHAIGVGNAPGLHPAHAIFRLADAGPRGGRNWGLMIGTVGIQNGEPNGQVGQMVLSYEIVAAGDIPSDYIIPFIWKEESAAVPSNGTNINVGNVTQTGEQMYIPPFNETRGDTGSNSGIANQVSINCRGKILVDNRIISTTNNIDCVTWFVGIKGHSNSNRSAGNADAWVQLAARLVTQDYQPFQPNK